MLWAGVAESGPLRRLAKACEGAARRAGLPEYPVVRTTAVHEDEDL